VSLFVLNPEIEDRDEVEVDNWAKHKKTYSEYVLFYLQADHKKKSDMNSFIFFFIDALIVRNASMALHLTRTFQLLGFKCFKSGYKKKPLQPFL
jgi:hypothetical protein